MARAGRRVSANATKLRSRVAGVFAACYVVAMASFWLVGAAAFLRSEHGPASLAGLLYFPILLLPFIGRGMLGVLHIRSPIWLWWFALQMFVGVAAIWLYPYDHPNRRFRLTMGGRGVSRTSSHHGVSRI
jgi:hypothetical protein